MSVLREELYELFLSFLSALAFLAGVSLSESSAFRFFSSTFLGSGFAGLFFSWISFYENDHFISNAWKLAKNLPERQLGCRPSLQSQPLHHLHRPSLGPPREDDWRKCWLDLYPRLGTTVVGAQWRARVDEASSSEDLIKNWKLLRLYLIVEDAQNRGHFLGVGTNGRHLDDMFSRGTLTQGCRFESNSLCLGIATLKLELSFFTWTIFEFFWRKFRKIPSRSQLQRYSFLSGISG